MAHANTDDGAVSADLSRGAVRILREYTGRGPTKARTVINDDSVAIILGDTLTKGERTLVSMGEREHVLNARRSFQQLMQVELVGLVEQHTGRTVEAFFSDNHIDPDYGVEFFILLPLQTADTKAAVAEA